MESTEVFLAKPYFLGALPFWFSTPSLRRFRFSFLAWNISSVQQTLISSPVSGLCICTEGLKSEWKATHVRDGARPSQSGEVRKRLAALGPEHAGLPTSLPAFGGRCRGTSAVVPSSHCQHWSSSPFHPKVRGNHPTNSLHSSVHRQEHERTISWTFSFPPKPRQWRGWWQTFLMSPVGSSSSSLGHRGLPSETPKGQGEREGFGARGSV